MFLLSNPGPWPINQSIGYLGIFEYESYEESDTAQAEEAVLEKALQILEANAK